VDIASGIGWKSGSEAQRTPGIINRLVFAHQVVRYQCRQTTQDLVLGINLSP
jgi:hypothetical protein